MAVNEHHDLKGTRPHEKNTSSACWRRFPLYGPPRVRKRHPPKEILNVSYDIARELYAAINLKFQAYWKEKTGQDINIKQFSRRLLQAGSRHHAGP